MNILHHTAAWIMTLFSLLTSLLALVSVYYVIYPANYSGLGKTGFYAILLSPQLWIVSFLLIILAYISFLYNLKLASLSFLLAAILTTAIFLWSNYTLWLYAKEAKVSLDITSSMLPKINYSQPTPTKAVPYSSISPEMVLELWPPEKQPNDSLSPAIVFIHGGSWSHGSRGCFTEWNKWLNQLGYYVLDVEYRMNSPNSWFEEVGDIKCALGWVVENAEKLHVDSNRISLMGYSAGGHLVLLAAYTIHDQNLPPSCPTSPINIRSVINFYGPSDLVLGYQDNLSPAYIHHALHHYVGGPPHEFLDRYKLLSPINHINASSPPTITFLGEKDRLISPNQAKVLDIALSKAGVPHESYILPASDHGFDVNWNSFATQIAREKLKNFLLKHP